MKFFLLGLYTTFHLVSIARATGTTGNKYAMSSLKPEPTAKCEDVRAVINSFLDKQKEFIARYFKNMKQNTHLEATTLCSTSKIHYNNIDIGVTITVQGSAAEHEIPVIHIFLMGECSEHIAKSLNEWSNDIRPIIFQTDFLSLQDYCSSSSLLSSLPTSSSSSSSTTTTTTSSSSSSTTTTTIPKISSFPTTTSTKKMSPATKTTPASSSRNAAPFSATNTTPASSSRNTAFRASTDKCEEPQGVSYTSTAIIGLLSFFAGMAVVLLCFWILYLKRSSKLCFTKPEKAPEKLTSDRVTKKVLAKHMLSATKDTTVTNAVYFKNETKDMNTATGTNNKLPTSEGQGHLNTAKNGNKGNSTHGMNMNQDQNQNGSQVYTTLQETEIGKPNIRAHEQTDDEHVYRELDPDHKVDINYPKGDHNNMKGKGQLGIPGKTDSDVFDHTRESAVSNHDYFVLQNENFRSSHQPGTQVSQSELSNEGNQMEHPGDTENTYFKLEKQ